MGSGRTGLADVDPEALGDPDVGALGGADAEVDAGRPELLAGGDDGAGLEPATVEGATDADDAGATAEELVGVTTVLRRWGTWWLASIGRTRK